LLSKFNCASCHTGEKPTSGVCTDCDGGSESSIPSCNDKKIADCSGSTGTCGTKAKCNIASSTSCLGCHSNTIKEGKQWALVDISTDNKLEERFRPTSEIGIHILDATPGNTKFSVLAKELIKTGGASRLKDTAGISCVDSCFGDGLLRIGFNNNPICVKHSCDKFDDASTDGGVDGKSYDEKTPFKNFICKSCKAGHTLKSGVCEKDAKTGDTTTTSSSSSSSSSGIMMVFGLVGSLLLW